MTINHSLDWMQYSISWPDSITEWPFDPNEASAIMKTCIPFLDLKGFPPAREKGERIANMQGYSMTYDLRYATGHVNPLHRAQKIGIRMAGQDCALWRNAGGTEERLVEFVKRSGAKASRVDIAFDMYNTGVDPLRLYADWKGRKWSTSAKTCQPVTKGMDMPDGTITEATTLYIGSRSSQCMVRIYEKGKQMRTEQDWLRVEIELKEEKAQAAIVDMVAHGVGAVGRQILREFIQMRYKFWKELVQGDSVALTPATRKQTDHEVWLHTVIIPMLANDLWEEWNGEVSYGITEALENIVRDCWQKRAEYVRMNMR